MDDPFASGPIATTLAWLVTVGTLATAIVGLISFLADKKDMARPFKLWLVLCLLFLAPGRYIFFQLVAAEAFVVQSFSAFFASFILALYVPIVFGILYFIGIGIPLALTILVLGDEERRDAGRYVGAAVVLPIACILATWLFYVTLPLAATTVRWLPAQQVVRATNGPAAVVFDYVAAPVAPLRVPTYFELTPKDAKALRRCHVASLYLSAKEEARFLKMAYPSVYEIVTGGAASTSAKLSNPSLERTRQARRSVQ